MDRQLESELAARSVGEALGHVAFATDQLLAASSPLGADGLDGASRLPGWSRRVVLAHLHTGALASARMTADVLAGRPTDFYPGGAAERAASLQRFDGLEAAAVHYELSEAAAGLLAVWDSVPAAAWQRTFPEARFGTIGLSRLVVFRLTELTVHGEDLDVGLSWTPAFVDIALPLRLAWLPTNHHPRPDADLSIRASWLLTDGSQGWLITADPAGATVREAALDAPAGVVLSGTREQLLRVLLGRLPAVSLVVGGDAAIAGKLKRAFPGP